MPRYVENVRQMRLVYAIAAIAVLFAIICLVMTVVLGTQMNPDNNVANEGGLALVNSSYQTSNNPMQPGGFLLSPDRTKMLLFTDNLYIINLATEPKTITWMASQPTLPFPYQSSFLTLGSDANLSVQILDEAGNVITLWTNGISAKTDNYQLQITNDGVLQILSPSFLVIWSQH